MGKITDYRIATAKVKEDHGFRIAHVGDDLGTQCSGFFSEKMFKELILPEYKRLFAEQKKYDYLIVELSSFQLEKSPELKPHAAVITNIASDHLDRHGDMDTYTKIKFSVFDNIIEAQHKRMKVQARKEGRIASGADIVSRHVLSFLTLVEDST